MIPYPLILPYRGGIGGSLWDNPCDLLGGIWLFFFWGGGGGGVAGAVLRRSSFYSPLSAARPLPQRQEGNRKALTLPPPSVSPPWELRRAPKQQTNQSSVSISTQTRVYRYGYTPSRDSLKKKNKTKSPKPRSMSFAENMATLAEILGAST